MELMKNGLAKPAIQRISNALAQLDNNFDAQAFEQQALLNLEQLELKERVDHIINALHQSLPQSFEQALSILLKVKEVWDHGDPDDPLRTFAAWPITDYIAKFGLSSPEKSLEGLKYLTALFSAEFAIRPFIIRYPELCHQYFEQWISDEDEHVRRLVSEGTRPRLPWGIRLKSFVEKPQVNIELLDALATDESLYVRRSVANHLNDIAKDHPGVVIDTCQRWFDRKSKNMNWLISHATRTLVKAGHMEVFPLLGYSKSPKISCDEITLSNDKISLGEAITFSANLSSTIQSTQKIVVDYALYFVKANGEQKAKVFKIKNISLKANESHLIEKSFSFKAISTRKYYLGQHKIVILINGKPLISTAFELVK